MWNSIQYLSTCFSTWSEVTATESRCSILLLKFSFLLLNISSHLAPKISLFHSFARETMATELVGGAILQAVFGVLLDRLTPRVEFLNFIRVKKLDGILLRRLKPTLIAARAVLNDAELKQIKNSAVKEWLDDLKDAVYDTEDLVDEISTKAATQNQVLNFFSSDLNMHDVEMGNKLQKITDRLESIVNQKDFLGLKVSEPEILSWRTQSTSLVKVSDVYGREKEKEAIIEFLLDDNHKLSVIPVVGMGGIGKTTLVQLVYNDDHVKQNFDLRAWVCVSEAFNLLKIIQTIIKAITPNYVCDIMDLNLLQLDLKERLSGKKFLVVLDDIWNENYADWDTLMNPFHYGRQGSNILVTTRSERVASMVKTVPSFYRLGLLSDEDCLSLFARHAFQSSDSTSNSCLAKIGGDIINRCKGLPLAAKALGGLFRSRPDIIYWNTILKNDMWDSIENEIIPALRVSYHYLPSHLKQCFVYCSLFPEDYEFDKMTLILMWMAEGFLQASKRGLTLEEVGYEYFDDLTSRSFFQPSSQGNRFFVMHDLIHNLATSIAGDFYCNLEKDGKGDKISSRIRHLYYIIPSYPSLDHFESCKRAKALRTFLGLNFRCIPNSVGNTPVNLLSNLKYLRVLSLVDFFALKTVPDSIGELIHLRYLDLSVTGIVSLPCSLCKLYNLQTLRLFLCCRLETLPNDMQHLVKLRYLDIRHTALKEMPRGLSKLKDLQFLSDFIVGKEQGPMIGELGELSNLQDKLHIRKLENIVNGNEAYEGKMMKKNHIKSLSLSWSSNVCINDSLTERDILDKLQPHRNLEHLSIIGYKGTIFPDWLGSSSYHMTSLYFTHCKNCCMLPPLGQLLSLKKLHIEGFDRLMIIGIEFFKSNGFASMTPFASLEYLQFKDMSTWEEWNSIEMEEFPKLRELTIYDCPKLTGDLPYQLTSLETLQIVRCPLLASSIPKCLVIQRLCIFKSEKVVLQELPHSLRSLKISGHRLVETIFRAMVLSEDLHLQHLDVWDCSSAITLPVNHMPPSMKKLSIYECGQLEFSKQHGHVSLESLSIERSCGTLSSIPTEIFPNLKEFSIDGCDSLNSVLVSKVSLPSLWSIEIYDCKNLKSLSIHMDSLLPSLKKLRISNCPEIEPIPEPFLPPSLLELEIAKCDKLLDHRLEWHLPSLTYLCITKNDSIKCFPEEGLLPPTLRTLKLRQFSVLESLDCRGLQYLTALQELRIMYSPKLQKMAGEMLPASLIKLQITSCDLLEEQCRKKDGEIWPKISHISAIRLTKGLIS